jgi:hypothetical protein
LAAAHAPTRVTPSAVGAFLRENAPVVANLAEYVTGGEVAALEALNSGEGAVVRQGLSKVAAYREEASGLQRRSAVCTHSAASCTGTRSRDVRIARATSPSSQPAAPRSRARSYARSRRSRRRRGRDREACGNLFEPFASNAHSRPG